MTFSSSASERAQMLTMLPVYRDVENIEPITKDDMLDFYNTHLSPASATRAKAAIHLIAQTSPDEVAADKDSPTQQVLDGKDESASVTSSEALLPQGNEAVVIEDIRAFKASIPLSEGARPVKDLSEFEELEPKL